MKQPVAALNTWYNAEGFGGARLYLWCPGCEDVHLVEVAGEDAWDWDGNLQHPTISPSILMQSNKVCHSFVQDGKWKFLDDCDHALAEHEVDLPPLPDWLIEETL